MKKAMVIYKENGEQSVSFFDSLQKAIDNAHTAMYCLGVYAEVYEYIEPCEENGYQIGYTFVTSD